MSGEWSPTTLTANLKELYSDDLQNNIPKKYPLSSLVKFAVAQKLGKVFVEPVILTRDGAFEYRGAAAGAITYADPIPATIDDARLVGSNMYGHSRIDFEACARGTSSKAAFRNNIGVVVESLWESARDRVESDLWCGGVDVGVVEGIAVKDVTITFATWAPGNFVAKEGTKISFYTADLKTDHGDALITKVDIPNRIITIDADPGVVAADRVFYFTQISDAPGGGVAATIRTMDGLHKLAGTTTGTLLDISTNYSLWRSPQVAMGGAPSLAKIAEGVAGYFSVGGEDDLTFFCAAAPWTKLAVDWSALKRFGLKGDEKFSLGSNELEIRLLGITVAIEASNFCKSGLGEMCSPSEMKRVGATELTDKIPGQSGANADLFTLVPGTNTVEYQIYSNQGLYLYPARIVHFTGITA